MDVNICLNRCWKDDRALVVSVMDSRNGDVFVLFSQIESNIICSFQMDFRNDDEEYKILVQFMKEFKKSQLRHDGDFTLRMKLISFAEYVFKHATIEWFSDHCVNSCPYYAEMLISSMNEEKMDDRFDF